MRIWRKRTLGALSYSLCALPFPQKCGELKALRRGQNMFNTQDLQFAKKLHYRCVKAGLVFNPDCRNDPEAILQGCRERWRYEYDAIVKMCRTCKAHGIEPNTNELIRQISSLLEMSANASDEDLRAMVYRTNTNREYFNSIHGLRLSPWAYLVYVAGRDVLLWTKAPLPLPHSFERGDFSCHAYASEKSLFMFK